jgi:hypothetical protein
VGVDPVVLGLTAVNGLHVEGVAENEGDVVLSTQVGEPVPAEDALGADDEVSPVGRDGFEKELGVRREITVEELLAALVVEDAQVHGASVQIDAAVVSMLIREEAHGSLLGPMSGSHSHRSSRGTERSRRGLHEYRTIAGLVRSAHYDEHGSRCEPRRQL